MVLLAARTAKKALTTTGRPRGPNFRGRILSSRAMWGTRAAPRSGRSLPGHGLGQLNWNVYGGNYRGKHLHFEKRRTLACDKILESGMTW